MDRKYEINDRRLKSEFTRVSFSGYKRIEVENLLKKSILELKLEQAQYWCAELVCIGMFDKLWELFYLFVSNHINISNPRVMPYLQVKYDYYQTIRSTGYHDCEMSMRNNKNIRECFAEIICVLCYSPKMPALSVLKLKPNELTITNLQGRLKAESKKYIGLLLKEGDPDELSLSMNELSYLCLSIGDGLETPKMHDVLFWVHWILMYDEHCRKNKIPLRCATRQAMERDLTQTHKEDVVWIIWDLIEIMNQTDYSSRRTEVVSKLITKTDVDRYTNVIHRVCQSILFFYKIKFTSSCKKKKLCLLYFVFQLLFTPIDISIQLMTIEEKTATEIIKGNINLIYGTLKANELAPKTDYLFDTMGDVSETSRKETQRRLELLKTIGDINY